MKYITRIAPSPTGDMHLGTARTAYFNWLAARASDGKFILRIDDTDLERNNESCVDVIYEAMKWLGLAYDKAFRQSERKDNYEAVIWRLLKAKLAVTLENGAIALAWHNNMPTHWHDNIAGDVPITSTNIQQIDRKLVLVRGGDRLGQPTYQLSSVVDDYDYDINYIIRGKDHLTNTAKQVALWWAIGECSTVRKPLPQFAHVGLIMKDKKKLSKRDGAASLLHYRQQGIRPDALLNFMLRLGWGPRNDNKENSIIPVEKAIKMFLTEGSMRNSDASMDLTKLEWFNRVYSRGL